MAYYNEKQLESIRNGLKFAKENPEDPKSKEITNRLKAGKLNFELKALGLNPVPVKQPKIDFSKLPGFEQGQQTALPTEKQGDAMSDFQEGRKELAQVLPERGQKSAERMRMMGDFKTFGQGGFGVLAQGAAGLLDTAYIAGKTAAKMLMSPEQEAQWQRGLENTMQKFPQIQDTAELIGKAHEDIKETNPDLARSIEDAGILLEFVGGTSKPVVEGLEATVEAGTEAARMTRQSVSGAIDWTTTNVPPAAASVYNKLPSMQDVTPRTSGISESLVAGINRVTPSDRMKFKQMAGESMESWLVDRGMTGTRNDTLTKLGTNFQALRENVDQAIDQIPGTYRDNRITTVAEEALEHARSVESSELNRMTELANKATGVGLTTKEINELKRYYERNVKVGYMQDPTKTAESVQRATNRDSQLREYLFQIADENGFDNLRDLNKEIQATKQLADTIAGRMEGQGANNMMSLTDWIAITPGVVDPVFISGFVGKKLFSTEKARSLVAKLFSAARPTKEIPRADLDEITKRAQERLARIAAVEEERTTNFLMAKDLQEAGFTMSQGDRAFITENPIPLTRQEQELLKVAEETAKYDEMLKYILDKKAEGYEIGEGFIMREVQEMLPAAGESSFKGGNPNAIQLPADSRKLTGPIETQSVNSPSTQQNITNVTNNAIDNSTVPQGTLLEQALKRDKDAVGQAVSEMEAELSGGTRISTGDNFVQTAEGGVYRFNELPSWVPDGLRDADLMGRVLRNIESGKAPRLNATKEKELQDLVQERITQRAESIKDTSDGIFSTDTAFAVALMAGGSYYVYANDGSLLPVVAIGAIASNPVARKAAIKQLDEAIKTQQARVQNAQGNSGFIRQAEKNVEQLKKQKKELLDSFNPSATTKTTDLLEEARKYDSVQDLIDNNPNIVFHGTSKDFQKFDSGISKEKGRALGDGTYFSRTERVAESFFKNEDGGRVLYTDISGKKLYPLKTHVQVRDGEVIFDVPDDVLSVARKKGLSERDVVELANANKEDFNNLVKEAGYDGVGGSDNIVIFDASDLKPMTRTQLEDIWKKANASS